MKSNLNYYYYLVSLLLLKLLLLFVIRNVKREPLKPGCPPSSSVYQFVFFDLMQG